MVSNSAPRSRDLIFNSQRMIVSLAMVFRGFPQSQVNSGDSVSKLMAIGLSRIHHNQQFKIIHLLGSRVSVDSTVTGLRAGRSRNRSILSGDKRFYSSQCAQVGSGAHLAGNRELCQGVNQPVSEPDHLRPYGAGVENEWRYT